MKQFTLIVEVAISDKKDTILIRNAQNGQILKVASDAKEVASFLSETIKQAKSSNTSTHE